MPLQAATSAATLSSAFLPLVILCSLTSFSSANPAPRDAILKRRYYLANPEEELYVENVISDCYQYCWEKFLPTYDECMLDNFCSKCYDYCPFSPYKNAQTRSKTKTSSSTTTTTPTTTTATPTPMPTIERQKQEQQRQQQQSPSKINKSIPESWSLHTVSMLQQDSLVLVDISWDALSVPSQCLISWEVSGGGLMGNLLTESSIVQLSLWPDTKYRVKVTCKDKLTGFMSRSLPLSIDTSEATNAHDNLGGQNQTQTQAQTTSTVTTTTKIAAIKKAYAPPLTNNQLQQQNNNNNNNNNSNYNNQNVYTARVDNAAVLPYDEHDGEGDGNGDKHGHDEPVDTLNAQHTNLIFNWHAKNSDISAIEPVQQPDIKMMTIAALADIQKPLLFGLAIGIAILTLVLAMYICLACRQKRLHDKTALMGDAKANAVLTTLPPAMLAAARANRKKNKAAVRKTKGGGGGGGVIVLEGATSLAYQRGSSDDERLGVAGHQSDDGYGRAAGDEVCSNPAICSRNALKV